MSGHVCPWWIGYLLISPLRRLVQDPARILGPYLRDGMTAFEPGPGMGFFTLDLARLVGPTGKVVAVDIQPRMLSTLKNRLSRAGLAERVETRLADADGLGMGDWRGRIDFVLAFAMVHELPSAESFFRDIAVLLKPDGRLLLAEPAGHVTDDAFEQELAAAARAGLKVTDRPSIAKSRAALLAP